MSTCSTAPLALFGLPVSSVSMAEAITEIERQILEGSFHQIALVDLAYARRSLQDFSLQHLLCGCNLVLADGAAMCGLTTLLGAPVRSSVTADDLVLELTRLSAQGGYSICLLGRNEHTLRRAIAELSRRFPGAQFTGCISDSRGALHEMDNETLLRQIEKARPSILLVGLGSPLQDIWIHRHRGRLQVPVSIGIGDALERLTGEIHPAPQRAADVREHGLYTDERHRTRVLPAYLRTRGALGMHLLLGFAANRLQPEERRRGRLKVEVHGVTRVVATPAKLSGECCRALVREARAAATAGQNMVVDLSGTTRLEVDGLGGLLEARRTLLEESLWIWLTGMSKPLRRVLQISALSDLFRIAGTPAEAMQFTLASRVPPQRVSERGVINASFDRGTVIPAVAQAS